MKDIKSRVEAVVDRYRLALRGRLVKRVVVSDGTYELRFRCGEWLELRRAETLLVKEAGTVRWLDKQVTDGDIVYDIGANIGIYTLMAAARVGQGRVYAFEPHAVNLTSLLHNIDDNNFADRVEILSCALTAECGFFPFYYYNAGAGTSISQLHACVDDSGRPFESTFCETKYSASIDHLIGTGVILPAHLIKIDVDGNEPLVLRGMSGLLSGQRRPRSIQVEVGPRNRDAVFEIMHGFGYEQIEVHHTLNGLERLARGESVEHVAHNVVFSPAV